MRRRTCLAVLTAALLGGSGDQAGAAPTVSPTPFDFGDQRLGTTSAPQTFLLTAYCIAPDIETPFCNGSDIVSTSIAATGPFEVQEENCPETLMAPTVNAESCVIRVAFRPSVAGPATGTLITGGPSAELLGNGVEPPAVFPAQQAGPPPPPSNLFSLGKLKLDKSAGTAATQTRKIHLRMKR